MTAQTLRHYYEIIKPGIIYGNLIPFAGAFLLASGQHYFDLGLFLSAGIGLSSVIASACVFNNCIDRDIDAKMERTKHRAMVHGALKGRTALIYGTALEVVGFMLLAITTNAATVFAAAFGFFVYVIAYSMWFKRHSVWGTVVGSLSGATPPVVGYAAVTGRLDAEALILFLILVFWQMPHFYAISIFRLKDYEEAKIPVLPAEEGVRKTKIQILSYVVAFTIAASSLSYFGYAGYPYLIIAVLLGILWFGAGIRGFSRTDNVHWAREMFFISLIVMTVLFIVMGVGAMV